MEINLANLRPEELRERINQRPFALLPVGTVEWHANHLPLGVDGHLASRVCEDLARQTGCIVAPPIWYGVCRDLRHEDGYFGTLTSISEDTLQHLVANVLDGLATLGFTSVLIISGHFELEHATAIERGIAQSKGLQVRWLTEAHLVQDKIEPADDNDATRPFAGDHAAEFETSLMQHYFPDLVEMEDAPETIELSMDELPDYIRRRYPRRASASYGKQLSQAIVEAGEKVIQDMLGHASS